MQLHDFINALPKAGLHLHPEGALAAPMVIHLARRHQIAIPDVAEGDLNRLHNAVRR